MHSFFLGKIILVDFMSVWILCIKIFFARILDVTIGTFRTMVMVKGKLVLTCLLSFLEAVIWFFIVREAIIVRDHAFVIGISYALGFTSGTLIGSFASKRLLKSIIGVQIITTKNSDKLIKAIKKEKYGISVIKMEHEKGFPAKKLLMVQLGSNHLKKLREIVNQYDKDAFFIISDTKMVYHGNIK